LDFPKETHPKFDVYIIHVISQGWGRTKGGGQAAVTLQEALLPVADIHSCSRINGKLIAVDDKTMLCAGGEGKAGGCQASNKFNPQGD